MPDSFDPRYLRGIACFNNGSFFEAHEVWEELWMHCEDSSRRFYQGLIQVAVCLHHFGNGNTRGAYKLFHSASKYLSAYGPWYQGVDLQRLLADLQLCCADVLVGVEQSPKPRLNRALLPHIHFAETCGDESV